MRSLGRQIFLIAGFFFLPLLTLPSQSLRFKEWVGPQTDGQVVWMESNPPSGKTFAPSLAGWFPAAYLVRQLDLPPESTLTGRGSFYLPLQGFRSEDLPFLKDLLLFLRTQQGEGAVPFTVEGLNIPPGGAGPWEFSLLREIRKEGFLEGPQTLSWKGAGQEMGPSRTLRLRIKTLVEVGRAKSRLSGRVTKGDFDWTWEPLALVAGKPAAPRDLETPKELLGTLTAGSIVRLDRIQPLWDVVKDRSVRAIFEKGHLRVEAEAQALGDGAVGDLVDLRILQTGRRFTGKVQGPGEVLIILP